MIVDVMSYKQNDARLRRLNHDDTRLQEMEFLRQKRKK